MLGSPSNRCIVKQNGRVLTRNKQWIRNLDNELYPKSFTDICKFIAELLKAHKDRLNAKYKNLRIERIHQFIQDIQMYEEGDATEEKVKKDQYEDFRDCIGIFKMMTTD